MMYAERLHHRQLCGGATRHAHSSLSRRRQYNQLLHFHSPLKPGKCEPYSIPIARLFPWVKAQTDITPVVLWTLLSQSLRSLCQLIQPPCRNIEYWCYYLPVITADITGRSKFLHSHTCHFKSLFAGNYIEKVNLINLAEAKGGGELVQRCRRVSYSLGHRNSTKKLEVTCLRLSWLRHESNSIVPLIIMIIK